jgi:thiol-disulfide isomerase/thioredoxin
MRPCGLVLSLALLSLACSRSTSVPEVRESPASAVDDEALRKEVLAWVEAQMKHWYEAERRGDVAACRARWSEVTAAVANETDPERRAWMTTGQFLIGGSSSCDQGSRSELAQAVLTELGFDDRRWSISPYALVAAAYETGRWLELRHELAARIATQQPEVAAYLALALYIEATTAGEWDRSEAIWAAWSARPELTDTQIGPIMRSMGPERRLAPGNFLPKVCVELVEGGRSCTNDLTGYTVIELWSTGCKGCREGIPVLRDAQTALQAAYPEDPPRFLSIDPYEDPPTILAFQRETPMPWTNAWVPEPEREAFATAFELQSIPVLLLIGPDGRILDSSPSLRADLVEARVHHFRR